MKNKIYELLKLLLCMIFFFCFSKLVISIFGLFGVDFTKFSFKGQVIYQFVISLMFFIGLLLVYFNNVKKDYKDFKAKLNKNIGYVIKMFFVFMVVKYLSSFVSVIIMMIFDMDTSSITSVNQDLIETYVKASPLLMVVSTAFLAPFYEEVLFRLGISKVVKNKYLFIIISGFLFGMMHVFPLDEGITLALGLIQSISYVVMGIFLAYVYKKTNNIFISIGLHFLNNLLSVLAMINML